MTKGAVFMKKRIFILFLTLTILIGILSVLPVHSEALIYDKVLRLHVIANSDSKEDQALKLLVRDAILEKTSVLLANTTSREEARHIIETNIKNLQKIAKLTVTQNGYSYPVTVELGKEEYPTKNYESCAFPAGEYLSLKVKIGKAEGQNWWCVLFPPMCLGAASDCEAIAEVGLTDTQYAIITETESPKYKIRFKLLEAIEKAVS